MPWSMRGAPVQAALASCSCTSHRGLALPCRLDIPGPAWLAVGVSSQVWCRSCSAFPPANSAVGKEVPARETPHPLPATAAPWNSPAAAHLPFGFSCAVGEEVPAKEAGDLTAAAVASPGLLTPVARLKLLQGGGLRTLRHRLVAPAERQGCGTGWAPIFMGSLLCKQLLMG